MVTKTLSTRSYALTDLAGKKCYKFNYPSIITSATPFTKDLVITVGAEAQSGSTLAYALTCTRAKGRPIIGEVVLNTNVDYSTTPVEKNLVVFIHEVMHIIGLSSSHFKVTVDANLNTIPEAQVLGTTTRRGKTVS